MSSLKPKILYQLAVSFLYSIAPVAVFPYISRTLGPENIGKINFIDYTAQFFILFASFGMPLYAVREVARVRNDSNKLKLLSSEFVLIHLLFSIISTVGFGVFVFLLPSDFSEKELMVLAAINILLNSFSIEWLLQGLEEFAYFGRRSFTIKLLSVAAVFIFIHNTSDYIVYYFLLVATNLAIVVADLFYAYKKGVRFQMTSSISRHLKPLSIFFLTTAAFSIYNYFDTVILGIISGSLAVGFYTTGLKTIRLTQNFVNDIGGVLLPRLSFLIAEKNTAELNTVINKSLQYVLTASLPITTFVFLLAPEIITVLAGKNFTSSIEVLEILSLLPLLLGLGNLFGTQILLPYDKERNVLFAVLAGCVVSIAANIFLCPLYQQRGAAIACIMAEVFVTIILGWKATRLVSLQVSKSFLVGICLSSLVFLPVIWSVRQLAMPLLLQVMISGFVCFATYIFLQLFAFKNPIVKNAYEFFGAKLIKKKTGSNK